MNNKYFLYALKIVFALQIFLLLVNIFNRSFNSDEIESLHVAWKILNGQAIYVDFFESHHPFYYFLLVPILFLTGEKVIALFAARILIFLILGAIFFFTFKISRCYLDKTGAYLSLVLLFCLNFFVRCGIESRPDLPQVMFFLLSLWLTLEWFKNKKTLNLILASLSLGISFLFLQKTIFIIIPWFLFLSWKYYKKEIVFKNLVLATTVLSLPFLFYLLYLTISNNLSVYFQLNWIFNLYVSHKQITRNFFWLIFKDNTLPLLVLAPAIYYLLKEKIQLIPIIFMSIILYLIVFDVRYMQYLLPTAPLIAISLSIFLINKQKTSKNIIFNIIILALITYGFFNLLKYPILYDNSEQVAYIEYAHRQSSPDDFVLDGAMHFNLFRKDADYLWFGLNYSITALKKTNGYNFDLNKIIKEKQPIIMMDYSKNMSEENKRHYKKSKIYNFFLIRQDE